MARRLIPIIFVWLAIVPARAAPDEEAVRLYNEGAYEAAAETAAAGGGTENLALAARALNAAAYLSEDRRTARIIFERAYDYAEVSIALDPNRVEGHLQAAISLAQRGARMAGWRAFLLGLAQRARKEIDLALEVNPGSAWALSLSAGWHVEVARKGGAGTFGSDPELGRRQFLAAHQADSENVAIAYECALRLLAYGEPSWRADALWALENAVSISPRNAFERAMRERALALAAAVEKGPEAEREFIDSHV
ncbi:MAG: hypothetical protein ACE5FO_07285 [Parvularculaceae bacterium]